MVIRSDAGKKEITVISAGQTLKCPFGQCCHSARIYFVEFAFFAILLFHSLVDANYLNGQRTFQAQNIQRNMGY